MDRRIVDYESSPEEGYSSKKVEKPSINKARKDEMGMDDELRPEYDLKSLKLRRVGPKRKHFFGPTVRIETDVAKVFPDSESVNEALRFLIRITEEKKSALLDTIKTESAVESKG